MGDTKEQRVEELIKKLGSKGLQERLQGDILAEGEMRCEEMCDLLLNTNVPRVQGIGDDFIPNTDLYNALGAIYPLLCRTKRDKIIGACLAQFDNIRYDCVQENHISYLREPLLLADITIARRIYWPGLYEGIKLVKRYNEYSDFGSFIDAKGIFNPKLVASDFLTAYYLLRKDKFDSSSEYVRQSHPAFLERAVKAVVNMRFGTLASGNFSEGVARLQELLPVEVHSLIDKFVLEKDWTDYSKFKY